MVFWQAERSVVQLSNLSARSSRMKRWSKIAEAAAQQSERSTIPSILFAANITELIQTSLELQDKNQLSLCCSLSPAAKTMDELLGSSQQIDLVIGPEGDLSPTEEQLLLERDFKLVTLGPLTLKSDTAAIAAIAQAEAIATMFAKQSA